VTADGLTARTFWSRSAARRVAQGGCVCLERCEPSAARHPDALERARPVQRYLIRRGVPPERIQRASRGARQALGEAPESWLYDRRVEIRLLPEPEGVR
jgi:hypothetical protein